MLSLYEYDKIPSNTHFGWGVHLNAPNQLYMTHDESKPPLIWVAHKFIDEWGIYCDFESQHEFYGGNIFTDAFALKTVLQEIAHHGELIRNRDHIKMCISVSSAVFDKYIK